MIVTSRPEIKLLLSCVQPDSETKTAELFRKRPREDLNWHELIRLAEQHAVLPLLYRHLQSADPQVVPSALWRELQHCFQENARRNLAMTAELLKLLKLFTLHQIPAIPYKGPILASAIYGDVALRQYDDLDVLVPQQDVLKTKALLLSQDYQPEFTLTPTQEAAYLRSSCEYNFAHPTKGIHLEIHWHIVRPYFKFPLDPARLWENLERISLAGTHVHSLGPEDLLLILCVHNGGKHHWERLGWICDVAELIHQRRDIQWKRLIAHATRYGVLRILWLGLFLAHHLLGVSLPDEVRQAVEADRMVKPLATQVCDMLFLDAPRPHDTLSHHALTLKMRERWRDRLAYCCRLPNAITVEDLMLTSLPRPLEGLYYFLRPIRLLGKYATRVVQR